MNKKALTEADIRTKFITPALVGANGDKWNVMTQIREEAWRVSIDTIKAGNFNLDLKNPQKPDDGPGDVDHLLPEYEKLLEGIAQTRAALKRELALALGAGGKERE